MDTPPSNTPRSNSPKPRTYATFNDSFKQNAGSSTIPSRASRLRGLTLPPDLREYNSSSEPSTSSTPSPGTLTSNTHTGNNNFDSSLVLRPRIEAQPSLRLGELPRVLLPLTRRARLLAILRNVRCGVTLKMFIFMVKVVSITRPCSPGAPNSWVYYPVLCLALLDFAG